MASSADRQAITLLATCLGHLVYLRNSKKLGSIIDGLINDTLIPIDTALEKWPAKFSDEELGNLEDMVNEWGGFIDYHVQEGRMTFLAGVTSHCLEDLNSMVKNRVKKDLLNPIFAPLATLLDKIDPTGESHEDYANVRMVLTELYTKVGFPVEFVI